MWILLKIIRDCWNWNNLLNTAIAAIILAAGKSTRMGVPKMLLPWGSRSVIETVLQHVLDMELSPVVVVTGANHTLLDDKLAQFVDRIHLVPNDQYDKLEMFFSIKLGIRQVIHQCDAAMLFLGDQPHISPQIIADLVSLFSDRNAGILIPSYNMRRGHPILLHRRHFQEILDLPNDASMKIFLANHEQDIQYLLIRDDSILEDMDSPEDYQRLKNKHLRRK